MKSKFKKQNAITLVALIITIIVLLILAMVSIALVMNSGIITKSKTAVDKYSQEEIQEQIKLAYSEWQTAQFTGETRTAADFVKDRLNSTYGEGAITDVTETSAGVFTVTFADGREYSYNVTTGTAEKIAKWNDNGDGTWTNTVTDAKIQIGDIVNYDPTKDASGNTLTTTYTSYSTANAAASKNEGRTSGYTSDQTFSVTATTNGWRVLGINESGQIELISADPIQTSSSSDYYLKGEKGYLDGPDELNSICSIFGRGNGAESARSLNVDDVDKLAGIKTDADKKALTNSIPELAYGTKWKYRYPTEEEKIGTTAYLQYNINSGSGYSDQWKNITNRTSSMQKFRMPGATSNTELNSNNPGTSPELTIGSYYYSISSKIRDSIYNETNIANILGKGTSDKYIKQWLASTMVQCGFGYAYFCLWCISDGRVCDNGPDTASLYCSYGGSKSIGLKIRPVVTLKSDVKLSGSSESGWTIE